MRASLPRTRGGNTWAVRRKGLCRRRRPWAAPGQGCRASAASQALGAYRQLISLSSWQPWEAGVL